mgnify:CR=1 FL=1
MGTRPKLRALPGGKASAKAPEKPARKARAEKPVEPPPPPPSPPEPPSKPAKATVLLADVLATALRWVLAVVPKKGPLAYVVLQHDKYGVPRLVGRSMNAAFIHYLPKGSLGGALNAAVPRRAVVELVRWLRGQPEARVTVDDLGMVHAASDDQPPGEHRLAIQVVLFPVDPPATLPALAMFTQHLPADLVARSRGINGAAVEASTSSNGTETAHLVIDGTTVARTVIAPVGAQLYDDDGRQRTLPVQP